MIELSRERGEALADRFGTPFYLYDVDAMVDRLARLRGGLCQGSQDVAFYFAVKANPCCELLRQLAPHLDGADISSVGELQLARAAGIAPENQSWAGPGKPATALREALTCNLGVFSVESEAELERLETEAKRLGRRASLTLRLNPEDVPRAFPMKMGGRPTPFGIPVESVDAPLHRASVSPHLNLLGFHVYSGTQCLDLEALQSNLGQTIALCMDLAARHDYEPRLLNLGGGFGIPLFEGDEDLAPEPLAEGLAAELEQAVRRFPQLSATRVLFELGRYIAGPAGVYVCQVVEVKECRGKRFVVLDGGMHHLFSATGNFGQLIKRNYIIDNIHGSAEGRADQSHELVGPLCTPLDSMGRNVSLPQCRPGDIIVFANAGAYGLSASPIHFLKHTLPAEVVHSAGRFALAQLAPSGENSE